MAYLLYHAIVLNDDRTTCRREEEERKARMGRELE